MECHLAVNFDMITSEVLWTDRVYSGRTAEFQQYLFGARRQVATGTRPLRKPGRRARVPGAGPCIISRAGSGWRQCASGGSRQTTISGRSVPRGAGACARRAASHRAPPRNCRADSQEPIVDVIAGRSLDVSECWIMAGRPDRRRTARGETMKKQEISRRETGERGRSL